MIYKRFLSFVLAVHILCLLTVTSCAAAEISTESNSHPISQSQESHTLFSDVPSDAWYAEAIAYCQQYGIMDGTAAAAFAPEETLTRAMLAAVLYRMSGSSSISASPAFADVTAEAWYSDAVSWASAHDVISGYGGGTFGVNDSTTREQAVTILWRYAGSPESGKAADLSDMSAVSDWALTAVCWANTNDILDGMTEDRRFNPKANIKRGEIAAMLYHYLSRPYDGVYPQHEPYGTGIGAMPGRVVWAYDPASVDWDGSGYWWNLDHFDENTIQRMVSDSIASLGGAETVQAGWTALFQAHNRARGRNSGLYAWRKNRCQGKYQRLCCYG